MKRVILVGLWILLLVAAATALFGLAADPMAGGVAWWAHVGGFATGLILAKRLAPPVRRIRVDSGRSRPP